MICWGFIFKLKDHQSPNEMKTQAKLNAICFYAKKDRAIKQATEAYFDRFLHFYLQDLKYQEIDLLTKDQLEKLCTNVDLVVILYSVNVKRYQIWNASTIKKVISKHQLKLLSAVCIVIDKFEPIENPLAKIPRLPNNHKPIESHYWTYLSSALNVVFQDLMPICREQMAEKAAVEKTWQDTLQVNEGESYQTFFESYPHSPYAELARKRYQEFEEKKLWEKTMASNRIHDYVDYLMADVLEVKPHRFFAAEKIAEMESDVHRRWQEVKQQGLMKLNYQFMNFFVEWNRKRLAEQRLSSLLGMDGGNTAVKQYAFEAHDSMYRQPFAYKKEKFDKKNLEVTYLDYLASRQRKSHEIVDYQVLITNYRHQVENVESILKGSQLKRNNLVTLGVLIALIAFLLLPYLDWIYRGFLLCGIAIFAGMCYLNLNVDIKNLRKVLVSLKTLSVLLRVALIKHDNQSVSTIMNFSRYTEQKAIEIKQKFTILYFYSSVTSFLGKEMDVPEEFTGALEEGEPENLSTTAALRPARSRAPRSRPEFVDHTAHLEDH